MQAIREAHAASYGTYGHRRIHAELVLGQHLQVSHGRVEPDAMRRATRRAPQTAAWLHPP